MNEHFKIDYQNAKSSDSLIIQGNNYRFTMLSEILIRIEYCSNGNFEDRPTEFARFRNFPEFTYTKQEDDNFLVLETNLVLINILKYP